MTGGRAKKGRNFKLRIFSSGIRFFGSFPSPHAPPSRGIAKGGVPEMRGGEWPFDPSKCQMVGAAIVLY
eukprot:scaffold123273_cov29-Tisochrysis_lutea.AAC.1